MGSAFDPEKGAPVGQRAPGRPRKITAELRARLLELLGQSVTRKDACAAVGISVQTLANTLKADPELKAEVHRRERLGVIAASECVTRAAATDPKVAIEYLARRRPAEWGKKKIVTINPTGPERTGREVLEALLEKLGGGAGAPATPPAGGEAAEPAAPAAASPEGPPGAGDGPPAPSGG